MPQACFALVALLPVSSLLLQEIQHDPAPPAAAHAALSTPPQAHHQVGFVASGRPAFFNRLECSVRLMLHAFLWLFVSSIAAAAAALATHTTSFVY